MVAALTQTGLTCAGVVSLTLMGVSGDVSEVAVLGGYRVLPTAYSSGIIVVPCRDGQSGRGVVRTGDRRVAHLVAFRLVLGSGSEVVGQWCLTGIGTVRCWTWWSCLFRFRWSVVLYVWPGQQLAVSTYIYRRLDVWCHDEVALTSFLHRRGQSCLWKLTRNG